MQITTPASVSHDPCNSSYLLPFSFLPPILLVCLIFFSPPKALADEFDDLVVEVAEKCAKKYTNLDDERHEPSRKIAKECVRDESERLKERVSKDIPGIFSGGYTQASLLEDRAWKLTDRLREVKVRNHYKSQIQKHQKSAIKIIQEFYFDSYPKAQGYPPLGKALDQFFSKPSWNMTIKDNFCWIVEFNGIAKWGQNNARFTFVFKIDPKFSNGEISGYSFEYSAKVNNNNVSKNVVNDMIGTIYLN